MNTPVEANPLDAALGVDDAAPDSRPASRRRELLIAAGVIAVGGASIALAFAVVPATGGDPFGPRWWPTVLGAAIALLGVLLVGVAIRKPDAPSEDAPTKRGLVRMLLMLAAIAAYGVAWYYVHFVVVTLLLAAGLTYVLGGRGWRDLILFPVIVTVVLYGVFGLLLGVPL
ncbi:tripartite tricarboxylate transporter TctB family protein [Pseudoclavibacter helvolus]|uniref:tripartite tricarboxylate transporter TctB family protein n=1 Tax=Pseudoclavibacter helvolus TaxID=255205 RepID=UPI003C73FB2C